MAVQAPSIPQPRSQTLWALAWRRFRKHKLALAALVYVCLLIAVALFAPILAPYDPTAQPLSGDLASQYFQLPSAQHWLGTDELGRDVFSRILYGARIEMLVGFTAALVSLFIGMVLGILAGYFSGRPFRFYQGPLAQGSSWQPLGFALWRVISWVIFYGLLYFIADLAWTLAGDGVRAFLGGERGGHWFALLGLVVSWGAVLAAGIWGLFAKFGLDLDVVLSRFIDFILTIPSLPLLLVLSALLRDSQGAVGQWAQATLGPAASVLIIITVLVIFGWISTARLVRGAVLSLREQDFVTAAQALGSSEVRVMFRHLLPNVTAPLVINTTLEVGNAILSESILSYLGFGIQEPVPSWGNMLSRAQDYLFSAPHLLFAPGIMIFLTILAFNYLGDGLRDALDPRSRL
ncbi:ABC transporter permease [Meiothermus granaticius]|uniref:Oligopeptide transport system permease protein OppC n=1 Tax=Meiothermus granaticius NBRC 107808 TaxID=1227551 RepID=A0A399F8D3_9DEIN|nr:ABC transporter permease [Meiothermus granaticius]MCL6525454.1 ABC transporter permease [Thermaceae bacterium]RIH91975.1 Oligopeptide transport system permease protein OppC [Meiothermus granaticius NBRC 107808]GEM87308.1 peptide ABC transporter permease [Meiothermus granaticius NBRC 107808]